MRLNDSILLPRAFLSLHLIGQFSKTITIQFSIGDEAEEANEIFPL